MCLDWRYYICTAGYSDGLCDGDKNRKCCQNCDRTCQTQESQNQKGDKKCTAIGGKFLTLMRPLRGNERISADANSAKKVPFFK